MQTYLQIITISILFYLFYFYLQFLFLHFCFLSKKQFQLYIKVIEQLYILLLLHNIHYTPEIYVKTVKISLLEIIPENIMITILVINKITSNLLQFLNIFFIFITHSICSKKLFM